MIIISFPPFIFPFFPTGLVLGLLLWAPWMVTIIMTHGSMFLSGVCPSSTPLTVMVPLSSPYLADRMISSLSRSPLPRPRLTAMLGWGYSNTCTFVYVNLHACSSDMENDIQIVFWKFGGISWSILVHVLYTCTCMSLQSTCTLQYMMFWRFSLSCLVCLYTHILTSKEKCKCFFFSINYLA